MAGQNTALILTPRRCRHKEFGFEADVMPFDGTRESCHAIRDWLRTFSALVVAYAGEGRMTLADCCVETTFGSAHKVVRRIDTGRVFIASAKRFHADFDEARKS